MKKSIKNLDSKSIKNTKDVKGGNRTTDNSVTFWLDGSSIYGVGA